MPNLVDAEEDASRMEEVDWAAKFRFFWFCDVVAVARYSLGLLVEFSKILFDVVNLCWGEINAVSLRAIAIAFLISRATFTLHLLFTCFSYRNQFKVFLTSPVFFFCLWNKVFLTVVFYWQTIHLLWKVLRCFCLHSSNSWILFDSRTGQCVIRGGSRTLTAESVLRDARWVGGWVRLWMQKSGR